MSACSSTVSFWTVCRWTLTRTAASSIRSSPPTPWSQSTPPQKYGVSRVPLTVTHTQQILCSFGIIERQLTQWTRFIHPLTPLIPVWEPDAPSNGNKRYYTISWWQEVDKMSHHIEFYRIRKNQETPLNVNWHLRLPNNIIGKNEFWSHFLQ